MIVSNNKNKTALYPHVNPRWLPVLMLYYRNYDISCSDSDMIIIILYSVHRFFMSRCVWRAWDGYKESWGGCKGSGMGVDGLGWVWRAWGWCGEPGMGREGLRCV